MFIHDLAEGLTVKGFQTFTTETLANVAEPHPPCIVLSASSVISQSGAVPAVLQSPPHEEMR